MKISKIFLETILPIITGTILFILYFILFDKFSNKPELESCESYELSNAVYLIFGFIIIIISSFYELSIGKWILEMNKNKYVLNIINCVVFGLFFTLIFILMRTYSGKEIELELCLGFYLIFILLGLLFSILSKLSQRVFKHKFN